MVAPQSNENLSLKAVGTSSQSERSSNSSGRSQVGSLKYLSNPSGLLSVAGTTNPTAGTGDMNEVLVSSANSSAGASSLTTGGNSVLSGNSNLQQSMSMNTDSLTSSGATSVGLPTSPLSFSSSNVSLPGTAGLGSSTLSQPGISPMTRLESQQDPTIQPLKLLKTEHSELSQAGQLVHHAEEYGKLNSQNLGIVQQPMGSNLSSVGNGQHHMRFGHQLKGQGLTGMESEQHLSQLHASMVAAKTMRDEMLQQQVAQSILQRPNSLLSAQLQRHEALQQQHVQAQLLQQQQRLLQQEQILRMMPPQMQSSRILQQQQFQQLQQQIAGLSKQSASAAGACVRRLMQYLHKQRTHPADNNIGFWRQFVSEFFAPHSRKRWCLSQCSAGGGRQTTGVFPQDLWRCEICGSSPGCGFEATVEVLPRLCKTKFDNGELEELLFVDLPYEYKLGSGLTVLEYGKAIQESVFEQVRVVWEGQLRIIFTPELKILSWDFCAKSHEELLPRRNVVSQVNQLVMLASKYQSALAQSNGAGLSAQELQASCNMFVSSARQLAKSLEPPSVNELGFTKRFVRCIQIAEVVNSMKDLIDFSQENNVGPIESLQSFPRRRITSGEITHLAMQSDPAGLAPFLTEQNGIILSRDKHMGTTINRPVNGLVNSFPPFQSLLRQNSNSSQSLIQADPSVMATLSGSGSLSNSLQASPTSSLTSFQTSVSSLTANPQPPLGTFQNPISSNTGNMSASHQSSLQTVQFSQQNTSDAVQHILQEMMNSGEIFHHGNIGNEGANTDSDSGMVLGVTNIPRNGSLGMNNGNIKNNMGGLGGVSGMNIANRLRNSGINFSQMGNIGSPRMLGNRMNLASLASQQEMHLQESISQQGLGLGGTSDFGSHAFNWK